MPSCGLITTPAARMASTTAAFASSAQNSFTTVATTGPTLSIAVMLEPSVSSAACGSCAAAASRKACRFRYRLENSLAVSDPTVGIPRAYTNRSSGTPAATESIASNSFFAERLSFPLSLPDV